MENLKSVIRQFVGERDWEQFHSPKNLAMALSVEVSEIVEHFQWLTQEQSRNLPPEKLEEVAREVGDVMIYPLCKRRSRVTVRSKGQGCRSSGDVRGGAHEFEDTESGQPRLRYLPRSTLWTFFAVCIYSTFCPQRPRP